MTGNILELKNTKIVVTVIEVLQDLMVVSYVFGTQYFEGVLLDSNKCNSRRLPCGVNPPEQETEGENALHAAITQRFTYFQNVSPVNNGINKQWNKRGKNRGKNSRMTVRLRPRQVLCSKCKSVCNENSENLQSNARVSSDSDNKTDRGRDSCKIPQAMPYNLRNKITDQRESKHLVNSLIPKVPRLQDEDICTISPTLTLNNCVQSANMVKTESEGTSVQVTSGEWENHCTSRSAERHSDDAEEPEIKDIAGGMMLRKKHSAGSMEDLWNENIFDDKQKKARTTPVLKISFGSEGTVLKIPSKVRNSVSESEPDENHAENNKNDKEVRKAQKRAKKEAKRQLIASGQEVPKKHKEKHKRKHRCDVSDDEDKSAKLSISLKRLGRNAYTTKSAPPDTEISNNFSNDSAPDFPDIATTTGYLNTEDSYCTTTSGKVIEVDDIVWAKVQGCPWWPGRVLTFRASATDSMALYAHISWFGSMVSSLVSCDNISPFLDSYKLRFNKHRRSGQYKEAVQQATYEAKQQTVRKPVTTNSVPINGSPFFHLSPEYLSDNAL